MTTIYLICFSRQEEEIFSMTCHRTTKPNYNETETILNPNLNVYSAEISHVSKMWSSQQTEKSCEFWISQKSDTNTCIRFFLWILKGTKGRKLNSTPWEGEFLNRKRKFNFLLDIQNYTKVTVQRFINGVKSKLNKDKLSIHSADAQKYNKQGTESR